MDRRGMRPIFASRQLSDGRWEILAPNPTGACGPAWIRIAVVDPTGPRVEIGVKEELDAWKWQ